MQDGKSANYLLPVGMIIVGPTPPLSVKTQTTGYPKIRHSILGGEVPVAIDRTGDCSPVIPDSLDRCIEPILAYCTTRTTMCHLRGDT